MSYFKKISTLALVLALVPLANGKTSDLKGKILLQVESLGQAFYVNPADGNRYSLGKPSEAFAVMWKLGIGISNENLKKIPIGLIDYEADDSDGDGLIDDLEIAIGSSASSSDSDNDGFDDKTELLNAYDLQGPGKAPIDPEFTENSLGKIFLQTELNGEAWYVDPATEKRYFLRKPIDAFAVMRKLSLGISNENLFKIPVGRFDYEKPVFEDHKSYNDVLNEVAQGFMRSDYSKVEKNFSDETKVLAEYTYNFLDKESRFTLGNLLAGAKLNESEENKKTVQAEVFFNGEKHYFKFTLEKIDGEWKMTNI